jgi:hypothetical protein
MELHRDEGAVWDADVAPVRGDRRGSAHWSPPATWCAASSAAREFGLHPHRGMFPPVDGGAR